MGGDMVVRVVPASPEITMVIGGNPSPPAKCAAIIEQNGSAPGNRLEDGARFVPASWHQKVARAQNGAIMACKDVPVGLLSAMIAPKDGVGDADFASARAVLESITAAVDATSKGR